MVFSGPCKDEAISWWSAGLLSYIHLGYAKRNCLPWNEWYCNCNTGEFFSSSDLFFGTVFIGLMICYLAGIILKIIVSKWSNYLH